MSLRIFLSCCALCASASALRAETITGTYSQLFLEGDNGAAPPFVIEAPAQIGQLTILDGASVTLTGGSVGGIELYGTSLAMHGGRLAHPSVRPLLFAWDNTDVSFYVRDITPASLASLDAMHSGARFGEVRLRLASGDLVYARIGRSIDGAWPAWNVFYAGDSLLDAGLDGQIGIAELNAVRNTFGSDAAAGDFDLDGEVGINDLNLVRNHFGAAYFSSGEVAAVPEPSALLMGLVGLVALQICHRRPGPRRPGG